MLNDKKLRLIAGNSCVPAAAIWNLSTHMRQGGVPDGQLEHIATTVDELNKCLDVDEPFTFIVDDPTGASTFRPDKGVVVQNLDGSGDAEADAEDDFVDVD